MDTENPFDSLRSVMAGDPRDWSENRRDAWLYTIVWGRDDDVLQELAEKFRWKPEDVARLKRLHREFVKAERSRNYPEKILSDREQYP